MQQSLTGTIPTLIDGRGVVHGNSGHSWFLGRVRAQQVGRDDRWNRCAVGAAWSDPWPRCPFSQCGSVGELLIISALLFAV
jgi:hypothetical protein